MGKRKVSGLIAYAPETNGPTVIQRSDRMDKTEVVTRGPGAIFKDGLNEKKERKKLGF